MSLPYTNMTAILSCGKPIMHGAQSARPNTAASMTKVHLRSSATPSDIADITTIQRPISITSTAGIMILQSADSLMQMCI